MSRKALLLVAAATASFDRIGFDCARPGFHGKCFAGPQRG